MHCITRAFGIYCNTKNLVQSRCCPFQKIKKLLKVRVIARILPSKSVLNVCDGNNGTLHATPFYFKLDDKRVPIKDTLCTGQDP